MSTLISESLTPIIVALIGAGLLGFVRDGIRGFRARKAAGSPTARETLAVGVADASLLVVAKARDELEEDNARLRVSIVEERNRHAEDRAQWAREKAALRGEIDSLEAKLRGLLDEVTALRSRTSV